MKKLIALILLIGSVAVNAQTIVTSKIILTSASNDNALTQVLVRDASTGMLKYRTASTIGTPITLGTNRQIPFMNSGDTDFLYSSDLSYNTTDHIFRSCNGLTINGSFSGNGYSAFFGESITVNAASSGGGVVTDAFAAGIDHIIGDGLNNFSGSNSFTIGNDNENYGNSSFAGGQNSRVLHSGEAGGSLVTIGAIAYGLGIGATEPVTAKGSAVNISRNTASQTVGHGAYGPYSVILGGQDHNIPSTASNTVILGGSGIKAVDSESVYVPRIISKGGLGCDMQTISTDITLNRLVHCTVLGDASGGNITLTLEPAADCKGVIYTVKKIDSSGNDVIIDANGSETIDGSTTQSMSVQNARFIIQCDGTAWYIIN